MAQFIWCKPLLLEAHVDLFDCLTFCYCCQTSLTELLPLTQIA